MNKKRIENVFLIAFQMNEERTWNSKRKYKSSLILYVVVEVFFHSKSCKQWSTDVKIVKQNWSSKMTRHFAFLSSWLQCKRKSRKVQKGENHQEPKNCLLIFLLFLTSFRFHFRFFGNIFSRNSFFGHFSWWLLSLMLNRSLKWHDDCEQNQEYIFLKIAKA